MKIAVVTTHYREFLESIYATRPELAAAPSHVQVDAVADQVFGIADFYCSNLRALGHEVLAVHANNERAQRAWASEHALDVPTPRGISTPPPTAVRLVRRALRPLRRMGRAVHASAPSSWFEQILAAQVLDFGPDVLLILDMISVNPLVVRKLRGHVGLVAGQHGAVTLPHLEESGCYDLVVSNFPPTLEEFRRRGVGAEALQLAFEPRILERLDPPLPEVDISFVGSFFAGVHDRRAVLIERLCREFESMAVWAPSVDHLPPDSAVRRCYRGSAWGVDMYRILAASKITINVHGDVVRDATNCRVFEATGVGTLLVTDDQPSLGALFDAGREVVTFTGPDECVDRIAYFLEHEEERRAIAAAGQARTLREHTYRRRMEQFVEVVSPLVRNR